MSATNKDHDGHNYVGRKQRPWRSQPCRPQKKTMTVTTMSATNKDHDGHNYVGRKQWPLRQQPCRPQTMTITATNLFSEDSTTMNSQWIWRFLKSTPLVFHVFIAAAIMVYLVADMVCGHNGCGHHGLWPSWCRPVRANPNYYWAVVSPVSRTWEVCSCTHRQRVHQTSATGWGTPPDARGHWWRSDDVDIPTMFTPGFPLFYSQKIQNFTELPWIIFQDQWVSECSEPANV